MLYELSRKEERAFNRQPNGSVLTVDFRWSLTTMLVVGTGIFAGLGFPFYYLFIHNFLDGTVDSAVTVLSLMTSVLTFLGWYVFVTRVTVDKHAGELIIQRRWLFSKRDAYRLADVAKIVLHHKIDESNDVSGTSNSISFVNKRGRSLARIQVSEHAGTGRSAKQPVAKVQQIAEFIDIPFHEWDDSTYFG